MNKTTGFVAVLSVLIRVKGRTVDAALAFSPLRVSLETRFH